MSRLTFERRILVYALGSGIPGTALALLLLWFGDYSSKTQWTATVLILLVWWGVASALVGQVVRPLQTLANLLEALREGDFSFRARTSRKNDAINEVMRDANALADTLREQRFGAVETSALLRKVMEVTDVAILAFDGKGELRLSNRAADQLLGRVPGRALGSTAQELGISDLLDGEVTRVVHLNLPGGAGRWEVRRSTFREGGVAHQLLALSDLSRALREEERAAWQRLVRVIGHEVNNSLAPIKSIAGSLGSLVARDPRPSDWQNDMQTGLQVIGSRAEALARFLEGYTQLAKLPPPQLESVDLGACVRRVVGLETRMNVSLRDGPEIILTADRAQLEQLLINLVRNAADAALETQGSVNVQWKTNGNFLEVCVEDDGPGISNPSNLFVPFFTTKPGGSGIGLALSRQIAEAHGGTLTLENRATGQGCVAMLKLPLRQR